MLQRSQAAHRRAAVFRDLPVGHDFEFTGVFVVPEAMTARCVFTTLPHGAAFAQRMVPALATGLLVSVVESVCAEAMQERLAADQTLVGSEVEIRHERPALPGSTLTLRGSARVQSATATSFEVSVEDRFERIATVRVVMCAVAAPRFEASLERKAALLAAVDARERAANC
ncbi:MAG: hotdog domain-containing protein [Caldimonas sp.]